MQIIGIIIFTLMSYSLGQTINEAFWKKYSSLSEGLRSTSIDITEFNGKSQLQWEVPPYYKQNIMAIRVKVLSKRKSTNRWIVIHDKLLLPSELSCPENLPSDFLEAFCIPLYRTTPEGRIVLTVSYTLDNGEVMEDAINVMLDLSSQIKRQPKSSNMMMGSFGLFDGPNELDIFQTCTRNGRMLCWSPAFFVGQDVYNARLCFKPYERERWTSIENLDRGFNLFGSCFCWDISFMEHNAPYQIKIAYQTFFGECIVQRQSTAIEPKQCGGTTAKMSSSRSSEMTTTTPQICAEARTNPDNGNTVDFRVLKGDREKNPPYPRCDILVWQVKWTLGGDKCIDQIEKFHLVVKVLQPESSTLVNITADKDKALCNISDHKIEYLFDGGINYCFLSLDLKPRGEYLPLLSFIYNNGTRTNEMRLTIKGGQSNDSWISPYDNKETDCNKYANEFRPLP